MKTYKFPIYILAICAALTFVACGNDDDVTIIITCDDGIQNGDEEGIDCGGSECDPCVICEDGIMNGDETGIDCGGTECVPCVTCDDGLQNGDEEDVDCGGSICEPCIVPLDFSGTYLQEDAMGRPGINTVFNDNDGDKNDFNVTLHADRGSFAQKFDDRLEFYHDVYAASLGIDPADLDYEANILGLDAPTFAFVLANTDALQVAPEGTTTYFDGTNALTGRTINDDVIDISLTLMFGGMTGTRFDGNNGTPQLTTDGVDFGDREVGGFPYLETPNN